MSSRFKRLPNHADLIGKEKGIGELTVAKTSNVKDRRRGETISMAYSPDNEKRIGQSLQRSLNVLGRSAEWLRGISRRKTFRDGAKKDFRLADELEYMGLMSLLCSYDYSTLKEVASPRSKDPRAFDYPRRTHSRHRIAHCE